jgi:hypothetical protein
LEVLQKAPLVVARGVEDEVGEASTHKMLHTCDDLIGVSADDP